MRIPCPICGDRDSAEFTYAGDAARAVPALDADPDLWAAHVYQRANRMGRHVEYWQHTGGCRAVLLVERDTVSHQVFSARLVGPQATIRDSEAAA